MGLADQICPPRRTAPPGAPAQTRPATISRVSPACPISPHSPPLLFLFFSPTAAALRWVQVGLKLKFSLSEVVLAVEEPCIAASHSAFWLFVSLELWLLSDADYCRYDARERSDGGCCCASLVQSRHWMCAPAPVSLS